MRVASDRKTDSRYLANPDGLQYANPGWNDP
jgi:hypothetical protein